MKKEVFSCVKCILAGVGSLAFLAFTVNQGHGLIFNIIAGFVFLIGMIYLILGIFSLYYLFTNKR